MIEHPCQCREREREREMGLGVTTVMVGMECLEVGLNTISKVAMERGMSELVYISYSNALAIFFLLPASLYHYSKKGLPNLRCSIIFRIFLLAQLSCCVQTFVNYGIRYSSPTLASAMMDLTPAFTFLLALISRMEKLDMRARSCWAKTIGTIVSITGALTVSMYKGIPITKPPFLDANYAIVILPTTTGQQSNWIFGSILLAAAALSLSLLFIVQAWIMKDYPEELMVTLIACIFVTIQSTIIAFLVENNPNAWILKLDIELITICYAAFFMVAIRSVVYTWTVKKKGPLYLSMFKPLSMVVALVMGVSFLGDTLYLGSLIGAAIIAFGFYSVIWGKAQEEKKMVIAKESINKICGFDEECSPRVPLLSHTNMDI